MGKKKKVKDEFKEFRNNEQSAYKTFKIPIKSLLIDSKNIQPTVNHLVFEMNDLAIHTYQFIRLYVLYCYTNHLELPTINETFILLLLTVMYFCKSFLLECVKPDSSSCTTYIFFNFLIFFI